MIFQTFLQIHIYRVFRIPPPPTKPTTIERLRCVERALAHLVTVNCIVPFDIVGGFGPLLQTGVVGG